MDNILTDKIIRFPAHAFLYASCFSQTRICLSFLYIQPQNMLKMWLSNNIRPNPVREMVEGIKMKKF